VRLLADGESGSAAIEFALAAPLFLMLLFGTVEFGRLLWVKQALQEAAVAGARCMALAQGSILNGSCTSGGSYSSSQTQSYVQQVASGWG
jgi:Flp pilus assembly protein TadG